MRLRKLPLRALISAFVAMAFAIAAEPGAMAMPAPKPATMASMAHATPACGHMSQQKDQRTPCKGMSFCLGMLACYGMAVLAVDYAVPVQTAEYSPAPHLNQTAPSLSHTPENPPPIA